MEISMLYVHMCIFWAPDYKRPGLEYEVVPILPTHSYFSYKTDFGAENGHENRARTHSNKGKQPKGPSFNISRWQLPILPAYAFTDYKIQGRSPTHVIIDLQGCYSLQSAYIRKIPGLLSST